MSLSSLDYTEDLSTVSNPELTFVASAPFLTQDLDAYLLVPYSALREYGVPEAIVSDSGGIFTAKQAQAIYAGLGIRKEQIAPRQPWQNYIETHFNIMRRMVDLTWT